MHVRVSVDAPRYIMLRDMASIHLSAMHPCFPEWIVRKKRAKNTIHCDNYLDTMSRLIAWAGNCVGAIRRKKWCGGGTHITKLKLALLGATITFYPGAAVVNSTPVNFISDRGADKAPGNKVINLSVNWESIAQLPVDVSPRDTRLVGQPSGPQSRPSAHGRRGPRQRRIGRPRPRPAYVAPRNLRRARSLTL